jgi:hypothetical protein
MNFSLKTFLIVLCVGGAFVGIMGKLLLDNPETFLAALWIEATILPFLLATGTIIVLGWRMKRRRLAIWGIALLLVPLVVFLGQIVFLPTGNARQLLTTRRLIERRLPQEIDQPWTWQELKRRFDRGRLTEDDVNGAIEALVTHTKAAQPGGWNQPLTWQRDFLAAVIGAKLVSDDVLFGLCDAFFGPQPKVRPLPNVIAGQGGFQLDVDYGTPWSTNSGLATDLLWNVKQVRLDGAPLKISRANRAPGRWFGYCDGQLAAGEHELQVDVECAYVDDTLIARGNQYNIPTSQWPKAKKRWTTTVTVPVKVSDAENK